MPIGAAPMSDYALRANPTYGIWLPPGTEPFAIADNCYLSLPGRATVLEISYHKPFCSAMAYRF